MSGFLYFIEGKKAAGSDVLDAAGLGHALTEGEITTCEATKGPGKTAGVVAAIAGTAAAIVKYAPKRQTWAPIETPSGNDVRAWIGYYTDDPPGPMDLLRPDAILDGYTVSLESPAGSDKWFIPRARIYAEDLAEDRVDDPAGGPDSDLPQALSFVGGRLVKKTLPRYRQACLDAERIWSAVQAANDEAAPGGDEAALTAVEEFEIAVRILAINYRVGVPEINALGVVTTASKSDIVKCFVDFPAWARVQFERLEAKKNGGDADTPDGADLNSGPPGG